MHIWKKAAGWAFAVILASTIAGVSIGSSNYMPTWNGGMSAVSGPMISFIEWARILAGQAHPVAVLALVLALIETVRGIREVFDLLRAEQRKQKLEAADGWKTIRLAYCLTLCGLALVPGAYYGLHAVA